MIAIITSMSVEGQRRILLCKTWYDSFRKATSTAKVGNGSFLSEDEEILNLLPRDRRLKSGLLPLLPIIQAKINKKRYSYPLNGILLFLNYDGKSMRKNFPFLRVHNLWSIRKLLNPIWTEVKTNINKLTLIILGLGLDS